MSDDRPSIEVVIARFEGKLDAWSMQQSRHEERLNAHTAKLDTLQQAVTEVSTRLSSAQEARRITPTWPTVVSAVVAAGMLVLFLAQQIYGA